MNKLLLLGLIGGAVYWLFRQSGHPPEHREGSAAGNGCYERYDEHDELSQADHQQALLDEALEESFPASDPPSPSRPGLR